MVAFEAFFYLVPGLMIALAVYAVTRTVGRAQDMRRAWTSGFTAQARCLRAYTSVSGGHGDTSVSTTLHHVYEFMAHDGRVVRFDEANGPATTVEGDIVTVHYLPERPERATAQAPAPGRLAAGTGCAVALFGVVIVICVVFMVIARLMFMAV